MKLGRFVFILFALALLSGCDPWSTHMMTGISNKHDGSSISSTGTSKNSPPQKCNQWCHNGWCSTHCEPIITN